MKSIWVVFAELWSADRLRSEHRAMARRGNRGSRYGGGGDLRVVHSGIGLDQRDMVHDVSVVSPVGGHGHLTAALVP